MKLPNWLLITWWGIALVGMLLFLVARLPELKAGGATFADITVFLVFIGLWVLPLVSEVNILGVKLKRQVDAVREELKGEIRELRNSVEVRNTVNAQVYAGYPPPPPDQSLPALRDEIHRAVSEVFAETQLGQSTAPPAEIEIPDSVEYLFQVRFSLERELRRIYQSRISDPNERYTSITAMSRMLVRSEDFTPQFAAGIRQVYSACSAAVHGEDVSENQVAFVRDVAPEIISVLRGMR